MPLISVIVPCYNQAQYLDECLQSVLDQTFHDWECIIVNDGSPDNTEEVAKRWVEKDARFRYIYKENGGLSSARNAGLESAFGEWIQFLDSDDFLHQDKFSKSLDGLDENISFVITDFNLLFPDKTVQNAFCDLSRYEISFEIILSKWDIDFNIPIHCALLKKGSLNDLKFNESLKSKEDWIFWLNYLEEAKLYKFIDEVLVTYRVNPQSVGTDPQLMADANDFLFEKLSMENRKILFDKINSQLLINRQELKNCTYALAHIELPRILKYYLKVRSLFFRQ